MEKPAEKAKKVENSKPQDKNKKKSKPMTEEEIRLKEIKEKQEMEKRRADFFGPSLDFSHILPNLIISDGKGHKKKAKFNNVTAKSTKLGKPPREKKEYSNANIPQKPTLNQNQKSKPSVTKEEKKLSSKPEKKPAPAKPSYPNKKQSIVLQKRVKPKKPVTTETE